VSKEIARRKFLTLAGAGLAAVPALAPLTLAAQMDSSVRGGRRSRALAARALRDAAARAEFLAPDVPQLANGDEQLYPGFIGNFSKGLPHDALGEVVPAAYRALLAGLREGTGAALASVPLGGSVPLVNPLAGAAFDLEGVDIAKLAAPPAPALASAWRAAEAVELYWMALARDVAFNDYAASPLIAAACRELSSLAAYAGPRGSGGDVTPELLFRGFTAGDRVGPYVSQLFLTPYAYGQYLIDGRITSFAKGADYLFEPAAWLACQNGQPPFAPLQLDPTPRYFRTGRDLAAYVHSDQACEAFYNAGLRLYALNAPPNPGNPYRKLANQSGFATFGAPHFLTLQAEAALRAVKAVFRQKWFLHRCLRPEEFGGRLQALMTGRAGYPLHPSIVGSEAAARVAAKFGAWLHPQAFPEGCPQHPSYIQAHGGVAGACATILKCAFDGATPWPALGSGQLYVASADGLSLDPYEGADAGEVTVNGEIEKLCGNIALARNFAGVHWRSDYEQGLLLGEAMALTVLADQRRTYAEDFDGFVITKFDGTTVTA
jgi:hypothetical protein